MLLKQFGQTFGQMQFGFGVDRAFAGCQLQTKIVMLVFPCKGRTHALDAPHQTACQIGQNDPQKTHPSFGW